MASNLTVPDRKLAFETPPISRLALGKSPFSNRKFSFPGNLHANLLGLPTNADPSKDINTNAKRRFSNVGDAVTRKLSTTIGWRSLNIAPEEVICQGKVLCGQYIKHRLKRSGIFSKKLGLYRLRSMIGTESGATVREVAPCLVAAGTELERMYPKLYTGVARQASASPGGVLVSDKSAAGLLAAIAHEMLKNEITWGKVVAVFAVAGGLAVDCVCQGHPEYLHTLMEGMNEVLEDNLAEWVASNGGWIALCNQCRTPDTELSLIEYASILGLMLAILLLIYFIFRFFGKFRYFEV